MRKTRMLVCIVFIVGIYLSSIGLLWAKDGSKKIPIKVTGSKISYLENGRKVIARGNVVILYKNMRLSCREAEVDLEKNTALAKGDVVLVEPRGIMHGDYLEYDFTKHRGKLLNADFKMLPYYGGAREVYQKNKEHYKIECGYFTTCDPAKPHPLNYRLEAQSVDIYPGEKVVARNVRFKIGRYTLMYFPRYVHYFHSNRPNVKIVPGRDDDWGYFVLTSWKYHLSDELTGKFNIDFREKRGTGFGPDVFYSGSYGQASLRTYYIDEKDKEFLEELGGLRKEKRYKIEYIHKFDIDYKQSLIMEYHKFSDYYFLKDYYYYDAYEYDPEPDSYILYRYSNNYATFSFLAQKRVNHFYTKVEYLPQVKYKLHSYSLGGSHFYLGGSTEFDNLSKQYAEGSPSMDAWRWDGYLQLLYSGKIGFVDILPFVGLRQTYYSRGLDSDSGLWRGVGYIGFDISTKLYRVFDWESDFWNIHKIRHVVHPWVRYRYNSEPTLVASKIQQFDSLDAIAKRNDLLFGVENIFQTKRNGKSYDFARSEVSCLYRIKPQQGSYFDYLKANFEFYPFSYLRFDLDYTYGLQEGNWREGSLDLWFNYNDKFSIGIGHQYQVDENAQTTVETDWRVVPGWRFHTYHRYEFEDGTLQEATYSVIKDLKCWEMELAYTTEKYGNSTFWFIMRIKAFPDIGMQITKSYRRSKRGVISK